MRPRAQSHSPSTRRFVSLPLLVLALLAGLIGPLWPRAAQAAVQTTIYAAPTGSGSACTDTAPCSLSGARDYVRGINSAMTGDIVIYLRGGTYSLSAPLTLDTSDSGSNGYSVIYQAYPGETPTLSGGQAITGWAAYDSAKNIYRANVGTALNTRQLYVNGIRAERAHGTPYPAGFSVTATGLINADSAMQTWGNPTDIEIVDIWEWVSIRCGVASISGTTITMETPCWTNQNSADDVPGIYWVENAYELLDAPGEWYLDRSAGYLYYKPRSGESMATASVIAPSQEALISGAGTPASPVRNLQFIGLTFANTTWLGPNEPAGYLSYQAGWRILAMPVDYSTWDQVAAVPGAVRFGAARSLRFERNTFTQLGGAGLELGPGSSQNTVIGNVFRDISANGIQVGGIDDFRVTDPALQTANNTISNNYITAIGTDHWDGVGIYVGYARDTMIAHNDIGNVPYSPISLGWGWGEPSYAANNTVTANHLYSFTRQLRDSGGVYTIGPQPASTISYNYIHHQADGYGAIYPDEASAGFSIHHNVAAFVPTWLYIWTKTIKNNSVQDNYSDTASVLDRGTNTSLANNTVVPDRAWPSAAQSIISAAGLEAAYQSIKNDTTTLVAPVIQRATPFTGRVFVEWSPTTSGMGYRVKYGTSSTALTSVLDVGTATQASVSGLTNGTTYYFAVVSYSASSESPLSNKLSARPLATYQNMALYKTVTASSPGYLWECCYYESYGNDNDIGTGASPSGPVARPYWQVDLSAAYRISAVEVVLRQDLDQSLTRRNLEVQASNDVNFGNYTVLGAVGSALLPHRATWLVKVTSASTFRYVRVRKANDNEWIYLAEVRVWNVPGQATAPVSPAPTNPPGSGTALFSDNFNSGSLSPWTSASGSWSVTSSMAQGSGPGYLLRSTTGGEVTYAADVRPTTSGASGGIVVRANGTGSQGYAISLDTAAQRITLSRLPGVTLQSYQVALSLNTTYRLKVRVMDTQYGRSNLRVYLNSIQLPILEVVDTSYISGQFGLQVNSGTLQFDNVSAQTMPIPPGGRKVDGAAFGSSPAAAAGNEFRNASDGTPSSYFDYALADGGFAGIDLGAGNARRIINIRYLARSGYESRMVGGVFQGSNTSTTSGYTTIATVSGTSSSDWNLVSVSDTTAYRYLRYLSPTGGYANLAEMEFYTDGAYTPPPAAPPTTTVVNPGFETGAASPWWALSAVVVDTNARSGSYALRVTGAPNSSGAGQVISGLQPNTSYTATGWVKVGTAGQGISVGVKDYGGSDITQWVTHTTYGQVSIQFTTGPNNTSAQIFLWAAGQQGDFYADDFELTATPPPSGNLLLNPGLEAAVADPWWTVSAAVTSGGQRSGSYALEVSGTSAGSGAGQVISGLQPNTAYIFRGWVRAGTAGQGISVGVKDYGGSELSQWITSDTYTQVQISFTTGASSTSAQVFMWTGSTSQFFSDDFEVVLAP